MSAIPIIERPLTDAGNAERVHALYGERFRYSHPQRAFFVWDGTRWAQDERGVMRHLARETARELYNQAWDVKDADLQDKIIKHARRSEGSQAISNMLREVGCIPGVAVLPDELDRGALLLNVRNGTLDLRTGELRAHRREDLLTKIAPVDYDPAAKCPRWLQFMAEVFAPHADIPDFLQRAVGYSLTAETREECLFLCHGTGRNGKGTFLKIISEMLGDYASTADFTAFLVRKNDGPRDDIANMRGRRLVRAEESNEGARLAEGIVKTLTGGDRVRARRLHENSYEFDPTWKIWLATNHKPAIRGTDPAIWSRLKLIPFEVSFSGREDRGLKQRLRDEMPGILAWAVEGCLRWQDDGLEFPDSVLNATAEYRDESDQVGRFVEEECITLPNCQSPARALYGAYRKWAEGAGEGVVSETEFGRRMTDRGLEKKHTRRGKTYIGVGLRATDRCDGDGCDGL
ncbi:MAG: phage/plasmid primase, P4 family [Acidobacteriota bacterium]